ncbi:MAG TPA: metallophosphoesterase [Victivallales bacterium]|nr:metallophosphoesterase [Victivallales bacterium]
MKIRISVISICFVLTFFGIICSSFGGTIYQKQLAKLKAEPPICTNSFDFCIVGDIQFAETYKYSQDFLSMIKDWNALMPNLIFIDGDNIFGGAASGVNKQWDIYEKHIAEIKSPIFSIVGGHDIADEATQKIFTNRIGPVMFSVNYGNSQFIALDTEENGQSSGVFSDKQLNWLKKELASSKAENIFIMMHQPIFDIKHYGNKWNKVAKLLKGYPVRAVFAGHKHMYRDFGVRDGIHYFISGGGGGDRTGLAENKGGFAHYILVQVRGSKIRYTVVKPGYMFPSDIVTQTRVWEMDNLHNCITTQAVEVPFGKKINREVSVYLNNPYDWSLNLNLKWQVPNGWHVTPTNLNIKAEPNKRGTAKIHVWTDSASDVHFPVPSFETVVPKVKNGGPIRVTNKLDLVQTSYAVRAPENMKIDGKLNEWKNAVSMPITYSHAFNPKNTKDLSGYVQMMWNSKYLFLAVDMSDNDHYQPNSGDIVWSADCVQFYLDKWSWELSKTPKGNEVFLDTSPKGEIEAFNKSVKLAIKRVGNHTVYEAAFPAKDVFPLILKAGKTFNVALIVNDLDRTKGNKLHWLELMPGWGTKMTGPMVRMTLEK